MKLSAGDSVYARNNGNVRQATVLVHQGQQVAVELDGPRSERAIYHQNKIHIDRETAKKAQQ